MASILIIEDDVVDLMAIKRSLASLSKHQFTYAASLLEARKLLANHQYDLIFSDFFLGDGLATDISETPSPIILMTGMVEMPEPEIAQRFAKILIKDMKHSHLYQIVENIQTRFGEVTVPVSRPEQQITPLQQLSTSFGNDQSFLKEMLIELHKQLQLAQNVLSQEKTVRSDPSLFQLAHTIKSQFLLGGFIQGAHIAEKLEQMAQNKKTDAAVIDPIIKDLQTSIYNALDLIEKKLKELK